MVAIVPNVCLWRRSLCSNLAGIDPEKLYRGTFICQYGLCCCIVWPSFLFDCFVKIWATCMNFLGKWFTAPLAENCPYAYVFTLTELKFQKHVTTFRHRLYSCRPAPLQTAWLVENPPTINEARNANHYGGTMTPPTLDTIA